MVRMGVTMQPDPGYPWGSMPTHMDDIISLKEGKIVLKCIHI